MHELYVGIDLGSTSTEAVVLDGNREIVASKIIDTEPRHREGVQKLMGIIYSQLSETYGEEIGEGHITYCVATGYGRGNIDLADRTVSEISCHARGVCYYFPGARTVVDIGGQDSKVIGLDESGEVVDFVMNEKCAAGTGRFLEAIGDTCEVPLDRLGPLSLEAERETEISSMCTVFAESEVISKLAEGETRESVIRGLHSAIAFRVLSMGKRIGIRSPLVFTGGVARNSGMVYMLKEKTGFVDTDILVPPDPQIIGALGAAFLAYEHGQKAGAPAVPGRKKTVPGKIISPVPGKKKSVTGRKISESVPGKETVTGKIIDLDEALPEPPLRRRGDGVIGWTDLSVPVELLGAAGIDHLRITGDLDKGASSDRYIRTYSCAYIKNSISALLEKSKKYDFIDGVISTNCCSATEKMSDVLDCHQRESSPGEAGIYVYPLTVPRLTGEEAVGYMRDNIVRLKEFLEKRLSVGISDDQLRRSCGAYNRVRALHREYIDLAASRNLPNAGYLSALELERFWRMNARTDKYCRGLSAKIDLLKTLEPLPKNGPNLMLAGSIVPDIHFYSIFDGIRCQLVYNNTSSGNKFSESDVDLSDPDIYRGLARRGLYFGYTPRVMDPDRRMARLKELVDKYNVEGIIFNITKFCVYYTFEAVLLKEYCDQWNIPLLVIETDFTSKSAGQLKTRIEAFVETFENMEKK